MNTRLAPALYPPTVAPSDSRPGLVEFLRLCVANPLATIPRAAYEAEILVDEPVKGHIVGWIMAPDLVERLLVSDADATVKSEVEHRVFDPILGRGILTADHADWRWQRRTLAPLFRPAGLDPYLPAMSAAAETQLARWRMHPPASMHDIEADMSVATFDVIVRTMLMGANPDELKTVMEAGKRYLDNASWSVAYGLLHLPVWLPHPATLSNWRATRRLRSAVSAIAARRRATAEATGDLLGRLLAARHPESGEPMPEALVVDNLATLLEAGHETTAKALTWTLYLLARAPEWQDALRAEARAVLPTTRAPSPDDIAKLVITERVLKEAMRLYPPAPIMARTLTRALDLGGRILPKGAQVVVPIFAIHRHQMLWRDPDRFDPDRFLPETDKDRPRTQFMPFGAGPRICIGQGFAMLEAKVMLATLLRSARFAWDGKHLPEPVSRVTLRPKGGMPLGVVVE